MPPHRTRHAMFPRNKPPTIRYYGFRSHPWPGGCDDGSIGGPPLLTDYLLQTFVPLDLSSIYPTPSEHNLGLFSKLPDELLYLHILEKLDLFSLVKFRATSRHAHYVVDTLPDFCILVKWAPQVLRGILAVQTNITATASSVVAKLRQRHCDQCDKAAQYIWLPTLHRLCFPCALRGLEPLEESQLLAHYALTKDDLHAIPSFRFLPTTFYGPEMSIETKKRPPGPRKPLPLDPQRTPQERHRRALRVPQQHILYDARVAAQLSLERTGKEIFLLRNTEDKEIQRITGDREKVHEPIDLPLGLLPRQTRRVMGTVFAPWITLDGAESGVFCQECLYITGKDRSHVWEIHSDPEGCEMCRLLRHRDKLVRFRFSHCARLPADSDVHFSACVVAKYPPWTLPEIVGRADNS